MVLWEQDHSLFFCARPKICYTYLQTNTIMGERIMKKGDKIGIVACSNGLKESSRPEMEQLKITLENLGLTPVFSEYLYAKDGAESGTRQQRAEALMKFYRDEEIKGIFDVSGGDLANGVLPWLDYEMIAKSGKMFWGYSDLTTVVNAITAKTGKPSFSTRSGILFIRTERSRNAGSGAACSNKIRGRELEVRKIRLRKIEVYRVNPCQRALEPEESGYIQKMSGLDTLFHFPYHFLPNLSAKSSTVGSPHSLFFPVTTKRVA